MSTTNEQALIGPERPNCIGDKRERHRRVAMRRTKTEDGYRWVCPVCCQMHKEVEVRNAPR